MNKPKAIEFRLTITHRDLLDMGFKPKILADSECKWVSYVKDGIVYEAERTKIGGYPVTLLEPER